MRSLRNPFTGAGLRSLCQACVNKRGRARTPTAYITLCLPPSPDTKDGARTRKGRLAVPVPNCTASSRSSSVSPVAFTDSTVEFTIRP